jgi:hypothetical protein
MQLVVPEFDITLSAYRSIFSESMLLLILLPRAEK